MVQKITVEGICHKTFVYFYSGIRSIKRTLNSVVFLDLKKNFDSVDSTILSFYQGYKGYVVRNLCHHWFKSCLELREKRMFSERFYLNSGIEHQTCRNIPQGTILGLLIFKLHMSDLPNCLSSSTFKTGRICRRYASNVLPVICAQVLSSYIPGVSIGVRLSFRLMLT